MFWIFLFAVATLGLLYMGGRKAYRWWRPLPAQQEEAAATTGRRRTETTSPPDRLQQKIDGLTDFFKRPVAAVATCVLVMIISFWQTSVVNPGGNQIAQFERIYLCTSITDGRNVALPGECGRQAYIEMPGFKIRWFVGVLNNVKYVNMVDVPDGHYAMLSARDGMKLDEGQVAARPWQLGEIIVKRKDGTNATGNMLDATFFLTDGKGQKGPQTTILPPGRYAINDYLWDVQNDGTDKDGKVTTNLFVRKAIPTGFVGVVKSAINEDFKPSFVTRDRTPVNCNEQTGLDNRAKQIRAVLVPVGCRGVWREALPPGEYFINKNIYEVELHDTRMQNLILAGGYTRRVIDLEVDEKGGITQKPHPEKVDVPKNAAGPAVAVKVEGWTVEQELRIQFRTKPEFAPLQAAAVGSLKEVEDRIIVPQAISVLRNIGGSNITVKNTTAYEEAKSELSALKARLDVLKDANADVGLNPEQRAREVTALEAQVAGLRLPDPSIEVTRPTRVLDFQNEREALEKLVAEQIQNIGQEAGVEIVSVTFGNPDIPPELLVARKVEQLSGQLRNAYTQMRTAQVQRQATEAAKARADQQEQLITQAINTEKSRLKIEQRDNEGLAEQKYNENDAKGQLAQANVLGPDRVMTLRIADKVLDALSKNPQIIGSVRLPSTVVMGDGGFNGAAAILKGSLGLGGSNDSNPPIPRVQGTAAR